MSFIVVNVVPLPGTTPGVASTLTLKASTQDIQQTTTVCRVVGHEYLTGSTFNKGARFLLAWPAGFLGLGSKETRIAQELPKKHNFATELQSTGYLGQDKAWGRLVPAIAAGFEQCALLFAVRTLTCPPFYLLKQPQN